jgi:hypothetical protein
MYDYWTKLSFSNLKYPMVPQINIVISFQITQVLNSLNITFFQHIRPNFKNECTMIETVGTEH